MVTTAWPRTVLVLTVLMALAAVAGAARADAPEQTGVVERAPTFSAWVFWDGDGLLVLTGPSLEQGCVGEGFQFPIATTVNPSGTAAVTTFSHTDEVRVYDDGGTTDPLEWLFEQACPAIVAGEPGPEPLASGDGRVTVANGNVTMTARVTTVDGRTVHLNVVGADIGEFPDVINYGG